MAQWLVIALAGPFASFAESAGNSARKTVDMPGRSALIGLAAAALGVRREEQPRQRALSAALVTAAAGLASGTILTDFHTFTALHQSAGGARSRADALDKRNRRHHETAITRRDYRTGAVWQGAYRLSETAGRFELAMLVRGFLQPRFAPYVGRRSCPASLPFNPGIFEVEDVRLAFAAHRNSMPALVELSHRVFSLEDEADAPGANGMSRHVRRDDPLDRSIRWNFAERTEWRIPGPQGEEAA